MFLLDEREFRNLFTDHPMLLETIELRNEEDLNIQANREGSDLHYPCRIKMYRWLRQVAMRIGAANEQVPCLGQTCNIIELWHFCTLVLPPCTYPVLEITALKVKPTHSAEGRRHLVTIERNNEPIHRAFSLYLYRECKQGHKQYESKLSALNIEHKDTDKQSLQQLVNVQFMKELSVIEANTSKCNKESCQSHLRTIIHTPRLLCLHFSYRDTARYIHESFHCIQVHNTKYILVGLIYYENTHYKSELLVNGQWHFYDDLDPYTTQIRQPQWKSQPINRGDGERPSRRLQEIVLAFFQAQ